MITENSTIRKAAELIESKVEKEVVILAIEQGKYIGLNEIGAKIWESLNKAVRVSDLILEIQENFEGDRQLIRNQVLEFLNDLEGKALIEEADEN